MDITSLAVVQSMSYLTLRDPLNCSVPGFPVLHYLQSLLKLMSDESVMLSNYLIFYRPLLLSSIFPSIRVFANESSWLFHQVVKVLELHLLVPQEVLGFTKPCNPKQSTGLPFN